MVKITVDGIEIQVNKGSTIIQACAQAGIEIPRFCYHEKLSIAGNCRMCLVEVEKSPKPVASCSMPVNNGMVVYTNTPVVKKAREGVMEFLLANHPLDCPICDQGGECDLQDQAMIYGNDRSRYFENKRAVEDKNCGPLIKTIMNRCIHCTRCVRFGTEIAGIEDLGLTGRGQKMEIGTYIEKTINSELSGNIIDLCPVGALTSKPYAFTARSWELKSTDTIDVLDAIGSNIRVDSRGTEIMRILPRLNEKINEEWISDKTRFAYDGLKRQRLDTPMIKENGKLINTSWKKAFEKIKQNLQNLPGKNIGAIVGNLVDAESMIALKDLINKLGSSNIEVRQDLAKLKNIDLRSNYILNTTLAGIEKADLCLLIGTNPRFEAPLLNTRLRKLWKKDVIIASIGPSINTTYNITELGNSNEILISIAEGKHPFSKLLRKAKNPIIIVGMSALQRADGDSILVAIETISKYTNLITKDWNGINILHNAAGRVAGLDLGLVPGVNLNMNFLKSFIPETNQINLKNSLKNLKVIFLLGADEIDLSLIKKDAFIIYQGHHGDNGAMIADVILPGAAYTEKNATFVNTEGRVQQTKSILLPPGSGREDWKIIRALAEFLDIKLKYNNLEEIRHRLNEMGAHFQSIDEIKQNFAKMERKISSKSFYLKRHPFKNLISNFFMTDPISRSSKIMAQCTEQIKLNY
jgi:NADH-quinone oxidoreductase subunit G